MLSEDPAADAPSAGETHESTAGSAAQVILIKGNFLEPGGQPAGFPVKMRNRSHRR